MINVDSVGIFAIGCLCSYPDLFRFSRDEDRFTLPDSSMTVAFRRRTMSAMLHGITVIDRAVGAGERRRSLLRVFVMLDNPAVALELDRDG